LSIKGDEFITQKFEHVDINFLFNKGFFFNAKRSMLEHVTAREKLDEKLPETKFC
jgi:hypothetical protein